MCLCLCSGTSKALVVLFVLANNAMSDKAGSGWSY